MAQATLGTSLAVMVWLTVGVVPALSAWVGGVVAVWGSVIYALVLRKIDVSKPMSILHLHFVAELAKLCGMFMVMAVLYVFCRQIVWIWLFAGFFAAYSAYWFGLLIKL